MQIRKLVLVLAAVVAAAPLPAQVTEPIDGKAVEVLRKHGLEQNQVMDHLSWMCDVYGPRLTGSPNIRRAQEWAKRTFEKWGLHKPRFEAWGPFGRGWRLDGFSMRVVGDNPWPVHAYPKAWSPGLPGKLKAQVVAVGELTAAQLKAIDLKGKIVMVDAPRPLTEAFEGTARRMLSEDLLEMANAVGGVEGRRGRRSRSEAWRSGFQRQRQVMQMVYAKQPAALLSRGSKGSYGTIFVTGASAPSVDGQRGNVRDPKVKGVLPQFTLAVEHYNRIARVLKKGFPIEMEIELQTTFFDSDLMERNVIAEIPGTDPKIGDQVVMLGGHFDSWHSGTGATDNGSGSAVMMEAIRLISVMMKETGMKPRRTIRIGLWSGEEQGLLGSRAYVQKHFAERAERRGPVTKILPAHARLSGYFNLDNGTGKVRGVYLQGNREVAPIFRSWLDPFKDLGASTLTLNNTGGTDHLAFDGAGLPGFQFIQDPVAYSTQTHHSNMDGWDHAVADDLQQASTIIASFVWHTAQRDEMLPRKALPEVKKDGEPTPRRRGR
ncbi:MAG: M28 family peptidase [Planctomycetota bacterium]|nr:M28 family peptidase [Planctomycetota bacterium]